MTRPIAGLLLAAGASRRLGEPKQLVANAEGTSLVARSAQQLLTVGCTPVLVVVGANEIAVRASLGALPVEVCLNDRWDDGVGSSIAVGVTWLIEFARSLAGSHPPAAVVISACDMPSVTAEHLSELLAVSVGGTRRVGSKYRVRPTESDTARDVRGIPALFPEEDWAVLTQLTGDRGAKALIESPEILLVFLRNGTFDIDTPADLAQWRADPNSFI